MAKQLNDLTAQVAEKGKNIRNLNLSYNILEFNEDSVNYEDSIGFMENIRNVFKNCKYLSHVNFSGMNYDKKHLLELIRGMNQCNYLVAIHLSSNEITQGRDFYYEVLDHFGISDNDVFDVDRSMIRSRMILPKSTVKYD